MRRDIREWRLLNDGTNSVPGSKLTTDMAKNLLKSKKEENER
jgi:hypothetical protein